MKGWKKFKQILKRKKKERHRLSPNSSEFDNFAYDTTGIAQFEFDSNSNNHSNKNQVQEDPARRKSSISPCTAMQLPRGDPWLPFDNADECLLQDGSPDIAWFQPFVSGIAMVDINEPAARMDSASISDCVSTNRSHSPAMSTTEYSCIEQFSNSCDSVNGEDDDTTSVALVCPTTTVVAHVPVCHVDIITRLALLFNIARRFWLQFMSELRRVELGFCDERECLALQSSSEAVANQRACNFRTECAVHYSGRSLTNIPAAVIVGKTNYSTEVRNLLNAPTRRTAIRTNINCRPSKTGVENTNTAGQRCAKPQFYLPDSRIPVRQTERGRPTKRIARKTVGKPHAARIRLTSEGWYEEQTSVGTKITIRPIPDVTDKKLKVISRLTDGQEVIGFSVIGSDNMYFSRIPVRTFQS